MKTKQKEIQNIMANNVYGKKSKTLQHQNKKAI